MFTLIYELDGASRRHPLREGTTDVGRATTCDVVLGHSTVSRRHARFTVEESRCLLEDLQSVNGTTRNGTPVTRTELAAGDVLTFGDIKAQLEEMPSTHLALSDLHVIVDPASTRYEPVDRALVADASRLLGSLTDLGQMLIRAVPLADVLNRIVDSVFAHIPAERVFLLLEEGGGDRLVPRVVRSARGPAPTGVTISSTIVRMVMTDRVAVLTSDARVDPRLGEAESLMLQNVRALMCAPLWNAERIIGVLYVDNPQTQKFSERQLQTLTALASHAGVAIDHARLLARALEETRRRERLQRYHSPAVVDRILYGESDEAGVVAQEREVSVLLADLVGFTTLAEELAPARLSTLLNAFLSRMSDIVFDHEGTLDKFIGDAILAIYGAPLDQPDHALRAVRTAQAMMRALEAINAERVRDPLQMRIAINTGMGVVGDIGSPRRREFTVLGDVMNTTARLESEVARPGQIVLTRATWDQLNGAVAGRSLGIKPLRGRTREVEIFEVER